MSDRNRGQLPKGVSGNPKRRPRAGEALSEYIRELGGPDGKVYVDKLHVERCPGCGGLGSLIPSELAEWRYRSLLRECDQECQRRKAPQRRSNGVKGIPSTNQSAARRTSLPEVGRHQYSVGRHDRKEGPRPICTEQDRADQEQRVTR